MTAGKGLIIFKTVISALVVQLFFNSISHAEPIPFIFHVNIFGEGQVYVPCRYRELSENCLVDTGSSYSEVRSAQTRLLPSVGTLSVVGGAGVARTCDVLTTDKWSIGNTVSSSSNVLRCEGAYDKSVIGIDFFSKIPFSIDFRAKEMNLSPAVPTNLIERPLYVFPQGHIGIDVELNKIPMVAGFDTGCALNLVDESLVSEYPNLFAYATSWNTIDATGSQISVTVYKMTGLAINGMQIPPTKVMVVKNSSPSSSFWGAQTRIILGPDSMKYLKWYINIPEKKWTSEFIQPVG